MSRKVFIILLLCITALGASLRFVEFDRIPPFGETSDEFVYPWLGISILTTGIPVGWSLLPSYQNAQDVQYWGEHFRIVSPWLERPSFYSLLVGSFALLAGQNEFEEVRLSTIRIVPIFLNVLSIILLALVTRKIYNWKVGVIASAIYATTPMIVLANRMSLTENLLIPLFLLGGWLSHEKMNPKLIKWHAFLLSLLSFAAILTKPTGIALPLGLMFFSLRTKSVRVLLMVLFATLAGLAVGPFQGYFYDLQLYQNIQQDLLRSINYGLPETFTNFFRFVGVGHKESLFLDGTIFAGFILLFAIPFLKRENEPFPYIFTIPYVYIAVLILVLSGATWYGWYIFPLLPFLSLALALCMYDLFLHADYFKLLFFLFFLGSSAVRFLLLISPTSLSWQPILVGFGITITLLFHLLREPMKQKLLISLFVLYLGINCYTVINLQSIYPNRPQPIESFISPP